ncbi:MAG TPA: hypothetical protein QF901_13285 [Gammaproteobacteria bacterium]|nr:hypothetical protein [Gammaproteobacteria bacterium]
MHEIERNVNTPSRDTASKGLHREHMGLCREKGSSSIDTVTRDANRRPHFQIVSGL